MRWKIRLVVNQRLVIRLQQIFAHAQNFVTISSLESMREQNEISIDCKLRWKTVSEMGPWCLFYISLKSKQSHTGL